MKVGASLGDNRAGMSDLVDIDGELTGETEHSYRFYDGSREVWVPKRHVEFDPDRGVFTMPEWLAFKKELI